MPSLPSTSSTHLNFFQRMERSRRLVELAEQADLLNQAGRAARLNRMHSNASGADHYGVESREREENDEYPQVNDQTQNNARRLTMFDYLEPFPDDEILGDLMDEEDKNDIENDYEEDTEMTSTSTSSSPLPSLIDALSPQTQDPTIITHRMPIPNISYWGLQQPTPRLRRRPHTTHRAAPFTHARDRPTHPRLRMLRTQSQQDSSTVIQAMVDEIDHLLTQRLDANGVERQFGGEGIDWGVCCDLMGGFEVEGISKDGITDGAGGCRIKASEEFVCR